MSGGSGPFLEQQMNCIRALARVNWRNQPVNIIGTIWIIVSLNRSAEAPTIRRLIRWTDIGVYLAAAAAN